MKTKLLIVLAFLVASIMGCKKDTAFDGKDNSIQNQKSLEDDPYEFAQFYLEYFARGLAGLTDNSTFRTILYDTIEGKFSGEHCVLLKDLVDLCSEYDLDIESEMKMYLFSNGYDSSLLDLEIFNDLAGHSYYPQINIPYYDSNNWNPEEIPTTVANNGTGSLILKGWTQDQYGDMDSISAIDSTYCFENEVWVLGINECVDEDGELTEWIHPDGSVTETKELPGDEGSENIDPHLGVYFREIRITEYKEGFFDGASEVAFRGYYADKYDVNDVKPGYGFIKENSTAEKEMGELIVKVTRKGVKKGITFVLHRYIANNWQANACDEGNFFYMFVIFERDWLVTDLKTTAVKYISVNNGKVISYRSHESWYYWGYCTPVDNCGYQAYADDYERTNSSIYFKYWAEIQ